MNSNFLTLDGFRSSASFQDLLLYSHFLFSLLFKLSDRRSQSTNAPLASRYFTPSFLFFLSPIKRVRFFCYYFIDNMILLLNIDLTIKLDGSDWNSRGCWVVIITEKNIRRSGGIRGSMYARCIESMGLAQFKWAIIRPRPTELA